jgi:ATP-dependent Clp protease ATP-binding subunit ClpC
MVNVMKRLAAIGFSLELSEKAKTFVGEKGYDQQFGARPLHRAIQKYIEDPLAEEILNLNVKEGDTIIADLDEEKGLLTFTHKPVSKKEKSNDSKETK